MRWGASSAERFGISARDFASASSPHRQAELHWTTPKGWSELPPSQFREANFRVAGNDQAECYLTTLAGEGGGLAANVNRWRAQMSLPPLGAEEIAALPRFPWLGQEAVYADFEGTWTGMSGDQSANEWRLVGLLLVQPAQSRFLKMTGPRALIADEIERFRELAASFHAGDGHAHDDGDVGTGAASAVEAAAGAVTSPAGYRWSPPAGWQRGPEKSMREITFLAGERGEAECYVTLLGGDGGGKLANVNRWRQQLGQPAITDADLAALVRIPMLGTEALVVEFARGEGASAPEGQEYLLGVVCLLEGQSLFVKMTGPREILLRERAAFLELCRSVRSAG